MQGEKSGNFLKNRKVRQFCCYYKLIFSQSEHSNFENVLGEQAPGPPKTVLGTHKNLILVWKSEGKSRNFIPSGD